MKDFAVTRTRVAGTRKSQIEDTLIAVCDKEQFGNQLHLHARSIGGPFPPAEITSHPFLVAFGISDRPCLICIVVVFSSGFSKVFD